MQSFHYIHPSFLSIDQIHTIIDNEVHLGLSEDCAERIRHCRQYLEHKLEQSDASLYGINTGFGSLCDIRISDDEIEQLQYNLVRSHACGIGDEVPPEIVRLMLLLKIQSLSYGYSGVRIELVERLIDFYNQDVLPVVYQLGSLGASGDLAPLAHLSLPIIGEGTVYWKGRKVPSMEALQRLVLKPLQLKSKEGLALLNGTQFSAAYGTWCLLRAKQLLQIADLLAAISSDAFDCSTSPFDERLHRIRPHQGQLESAMNVRHYLEGSELSNREKNNVQDPYAFRCVPQVHGASRDAIRYVEQVFLTEINSVTDNPNIFPDDDLILSGGNFHAQPLALALDHMAIALAEIGNISERRVFQLISGKRGLPVFLTPNAGLFSGLMIPQYTAASIVSQNKQLATPASVDSIVSSNGQEDHVSMAANAATRTYRIVQNLERILAIEMMTAAQALEFRRPARSSATIEELIAAYRQHVPRLEADRILSTDMQTTVEFLRNLNI